MRLSNRAVWRTEEVCDAWITYRLSYATLEYNTDCSVALTNKRLAAFRNWLFRVGSIILVD